MNLLSWFFRISTSWRSVIGIILFGEYFVRHFLGYGGDVFDRWRKVVTIFFNLVVWQWIWGIIGASYLLNVRVNALVKQKTIIKDQSSIIRRYKALSSLHCLYAFGRERERLDVLSEIILEEFVKPTDSNQMLELEIKPRKEKNNLMITHRFRTQIKLTDNNLRIIGLLVFVIFMSMSDAKGERNWPSIEKENEIETWWIEKLFEATTRWRRS